MPSPAISAQPGSSPPPRWKRIIVRSVIGGSVCSIILTLLASGQTSQPWRLFSSRGGWSIRHPADWKVSSCRACSDPTEPGLFVFFTAPDGPCHLINGTMRVCRSNGAILVSPQRGKPVNKSATDWLAELRAAELKSHPNPREMREWTTTVADSPAVIIRFYDDGGMDLEEVLVVAGSRAFNLSFAIMRTSDDREPLQELDSYKTYLRMLRSFKVTGDSPTHESISSQ